MDEWIKAKIGLKKEERLTKEAIASYQLDKLTQTLAYVKAKSKFYKNIYQGLDLDAIKTLKDFEKLPFTTANDIVMQGQRMICVRQDDIHRIVTLDTSSTMGKAKRIYFTKEDQELTIDFFHHGMRNLVGKGDKVLILLPCQTPGCVGDLLRQGLQRDGINVIGYGLIDDYIKITMLTKEMGITSIVGNPVQLLTLAEMGKNLSISINSVLLSTDYVPDSINQRLEKIWGCKVFEHYGMTETGLGCGVFCKELTGYHMREADLYYEVISENGQVVEDGTYGELVVTTLTRKAMPLIRYRTGDYGRWEKRDCLCGSQLKLMGKVKHRLMPNENDFMWHNQPLHITDLDESIFSVEGVVNYNAMLEEDFLYLQLKCLETNEDEGITAKKMINQVTYQLERVYGRDLKVKIDCHFGSEKPLSALIKRKIMRNLDII